MGTRGTHEIARFAVAAALIFATVTTTGVVAPSIAYAADAKIKKHRVYKGQTLGKIAKRYRITVDALREANRIGNKDPIKPGQMLWIPPRSDEDGKKTRAARDKAEGRASSDGNEPPRKAAKSDDAKAPSRKELAAGVRWHEVVKGQKLGSIARRYHVTVAALTHANGIDERAPIQPGQMLLVPHRDDEGGAVARDLRDAGLRPSSPDEPKSPAKRATKAPKNSWDPYVKKPPRPRYITIVGRHDRSWRGTAVTKRGNARSYARKHIAEVLATKSGETKPIDKRLVELLAKVSDTFGGRTIRVVSGVRLGNTNETSRHRQGKAVDFVVDGVPNDVLRDYLKTFDQVGVGFYPNSHFVHLDVRERWTYWIDLSRPGERPRYAGFWTKASKSAKPRRRRIKGEKAVEPGKASDQDR
ncbi:MAG TPA: LysM peptidoglycan-binding domain-containing protein [Polyangiaceae bacterium]|nr:LysM peptidoglycan-binding domain-containing protein [Polyangiaceae bacterium]